MAGAAQDYIFGPVLLVPIPLHYLRLWQRGFNQAQLLGQVVAKELQVPLVSPLKRVRHTQPQFGLGRHLRRANVVGAFAIKSDQLDIIKDKTVVLVDDVVATGSTIEECARVLKNNGAKEVWALVLARA